MDRSTEMALPSTLEDTPIEVRVGYTSSDSAAKAEQRKNSTVIQGISFLLSALSGLQTTRRSYVSFFMTVPTAIPLTEGI